MLADEPLAAVGRVAGIVEDQQSGSARIRRAELFELVGGHLPAVTGACRQEADTAADVGADGYRPVLATRRRRDRSLPGGDELSSEPRGLETDLEDIHC
jgi:hypothetical protein